MPGAHDLGAPGPLFFGCHKLFLPNIKKHIAERVHTVEHMVCAYYAQLITLLWKGAKNLRVYSTYIGVKPFQLSKPNTRIAKLPRYYKKKHYQFSRNYKRIWFTYGRGWHHGLLHGTTWTSLFERNCHKCITAILKINCWEKNATAVNYSCFFWLKFRNFFTRKTIYQP